MKHYSVLKDESIKGLNIKDDGIYVDATLGYGGHSVEILKRVKKGFLFAFDQDIDAIKESGLRLSEIGSNYKVFNNNFSELEQCLVQEQISKIDGIMFDLGLSSPELDSETRGFSYHIDAPLDMRMDQSGEITAYDVVNNYSFEDLWRIFTVYGDEKYAKQIARNIEKSREVKKIASTFELVEIIKGSMPYKATKDKHPAKKVFQAIRIEVNKEFDVIEKALDSAVKVLEVSGRLVVITFHSGEEKKVMEVLKKYIDVSPELRKLPSIPEKYLPVLKLVEKVKPSKNELLENSRSHSAVLRVFEKVRER